MRFDLFHSLARIDTVRPQLSDRQVFELFFRQVELGEALGFGTMWVAESHFSSETQKRNPAAVIPHFMGEVGLNCDSVQLAQQVLARTRRLGFGTAILNIVGGNGGPIAAADRIRMLSWYNALSDSPRRLDIGVASGRFPYINQPFGIAPRSPEEKALWPQYQQLIFVEALEIFLRLLSGDCLGSDAVSRHRIDRRFFRDDASYEAVCRELGGESWEYEPRWRFAPLKLVPELPVADWKRFMTIVLGSADPYARDHALRFGDLDLFNLSFTPPAQIDATHAVMRERYAEASKSWHRSRMPRTVLVFIDETNAAAERRASTCFDTYIEAMRGTVATPDKDVLMARALIGDPQRVKEQLAPDDPHAFHPDDRLMLWFEFNQADGAAIERQMRLFAEDVLPHYVQEGN